MKSLKTGILCIIAFTILHCEKGKEAMFSSADYHINAIYVDAENKIWVGTQTNLISNINNKWTVYDDESLNGATCFAKIGETLQVGTNNGVCILAQKNSSIEVIQKITTSNSEIASDSITAIKLGPDGLIWYGTNAGLSFYNNGTWIKNADKQLIGREITDIAFVGNNYFVSTNNWYIWNCKYQPEVDGFSGATQLIWDFNGDFTVGQINCAINSTGGYLWFGSPKGLTRLFGHTHAARGEFTYFCEGTNILSLYEASNGDIWIGKETGISKYNGEMQHFTTEDGLADNEVNTISEDKDGTIWIGTPKGISKFDGTIWETI